MSRNSYNNIKKYAAFIFMVFTVLSGSSDGADSENFAKLGRKAFIDILSTNRAFIQDAKVSIGQSHLRSSVNDDDSFRSFLDTDIENTSLNNIQAYILLIIPVYYFNNLILKNSIWKSAVF